MIYAPRPYLVTIQRKDAEPEDMRMVGVSRTEVLYSVMELFPEWRVVRIQQEDEW